MKNHLLFSVMKMLFLSLGVLGYSNIVKSNIEQTAQYNDAGYCHNGGMGSTQCSIDAGINIAGHGVSSSCEVTYALGYYACCTLRCTCFPIPN